MTSSRLTKQSQNSKCRLKLLKERTARESPCHCLRKRPVRKVPKSRRNKRASVEKSLDLSRLEKSLDLRQTGEEADQQWFQTYSEQEDKSLPEGNEEKNPEEEQHDENLKDQEERESGNDLCAQADLDCHHTEPMEDEGQGEGTEVTPFQHDWADLPESALLRVCGLLCDWDVCSTAAVCRAWRRLLQEPCLRKTRKLSVDDVSLRFLKTRGKDIQHLTLTFPERWSCGTLRAMLECMQSLSLQSITLRSEGGGLQCGGEGEEGELLARMLRTQEGLRGLALGGLGVRLGSGRTLCQAAPRSLTDLHLCQLFLEMDNGVPLFSVFSVWRWLKSYKHLQRLCVMYDYLSADHVDALSAHKLGRTLQLLQLCVTKHTPRRHKFPRAIWKRWTAVNPDLKVDLFLEDCPFAFVKNLVSASIPLSTLRLRLSRDNAMPDTEDSLNLTLGHVAQTCPLLERLDIKDKELMGPSVERGIREVLAACTGLQRLEVSAPVSLDFVSWLCQRQAARQLSLKRTRVTVQALEAEEIRTLNSMVKHYQPLLPAGVSMTAEAGIRIESDAPDSLSVWA